MWIYLVGVIITMFSLVFLEGEFYHNKFVSKNNGQSVASGVFSIIAIGGLWWYFILHPFGNMTEKRQYTLRYEALTVNGVIKSKSKFMGVDVKGYDNVVRDTIFASVISEARKQEVEKIMDKPLPSIEDYKTENKLIWLFYIIFLFPISYFLISMAYLIRGYLFIRSIKGQEKLLFVRRIMTGDSFVMKKSFIINPWKSIDMSRLNKAETKIVNCKLLKSSKIFSLQYIKNIKELFKRK
jgi:hypothetical protein